MPTCGGSSFYEVTFQRRIGSGAWRTIGVDDSAPYRVFDDTSYLRPGVSGSATAPPSWTTPVTPAAA